MSKSPPESQAPLTLRASKTLSMGRNREGQAPEAVAVAPLLPGAAALDQAPAAAGAAGDEWHTVPALAACGMALLFGAGWLLERRRRLVERTQSQVDTSANANASANAHHIGPAMQPEQRHEQPVGPPVDAMVALAAQLAEPDALQPQQSFPAQREHRPRHRHVLDVASQKRLIKALMWLRVAAGATAILAAIAIGVFWAIEATTNLAAGETGLTSSLLIVLLVGWAMSWSAGQVANQLHRLYFNRVHPKFDN